MRPAHSRPTRPGIRCLLLTRLSPLVAVTGAAQPSPDWNVAGRMPRPGSKNTVARGLAGDKGHSWGGEQPGWDRPVLRKEAAVLPWRDFTHAAVS